MIQKCFLSSQIYSQNSPARPRTLLHFISEPWPIRYSALDAVGLQPVSVVAETGNGPLVQLQWEDPALPSPAVNYNMLICSPFSSYGTFLY